MEDLRISDDWQKICKTIVYDPDGWDRQNYQYSWFEEKITRREFEMRLCISTCFWAKPVDSNIWRDLDDE